MKVNVGNDGAVAVEGPKGKLNWKLPRNISAKVETITSTARAAETRSVKALHGLSRALLNNMVRGVSEGFSKDLEIEGVGFKAAVQGQKLNLTLGFSHPILFPIPKDIKITVTENTKLTISGIDKKLVGQVAADIRRYYPPEPYKGKACVMRASRFGARKARPFNNYGDESKSNPPAYSPAHPEESVVERPKAASRRPFFRASMFTRR